MEKHLPLTGRRRLGDLGYRYSWMGFLWLRFCLFFLFEIQFYFAAEILVLEFVIYLSYSIRTCFRKTSSVQCGIKKISPLPGKDCMHSTLWSLSLSLSLILQLTFARLFLLQLWRTHIKRPMILVGPSLGAAVAIDFAVNFPEAVCLSTLFNWCCFFLMLTETLCRWIGWFWLMQVFM